MSKRKTWVIISLLAFTAAALAWGARDQLWRWLLALHGIH
jgi:hypothetical protein